MEQRIDALEQDMKLIKNQIKAVLLDIKESLATGVGTPVYITQGEGAESTDAGSNSKEDRHPQSGPATGHSEPVRTFSGSAVDGGYPGVVNVGSVPFDNFSAPVPPMAPMVNMAAAAPGAPVHQTVQEAGVPYAAIESSAGVPGKSEPGPNISQANPKENLHNVNYAGNDSGQVIDMLTLSVMAQWMSRAVSSVGTEQVIKLVSIYDMTGNLPERLKETMLMLADFHGNGHSENGHDDGDSDQAPGKDKTEGIMQLMIELDSLIHCRNSAFESVVLSLLNEKGTGK